MSTDPISLLSRAIDQAAIVLDSAERADPAAPTPCSGWHVADLVDHILFGASQFTVAASGGTPDWQLTAPHVDNAYGATFRANAGGIVDTWRASGDVDRIIALPIGERPASFVITQQTAEFAVHAWDLATAIGQRVNWDSDVAETALAWSKTTLLPQFRGEGRPFGAEVSIADDAAAQDRLVAWFGRWP